MTALATVQVIFDLDGTLIDSLPDLHHALNQMLAGYGRDPLPLEQVRTLVGDGAGILVGRALEARGLPATAQGEALSRFLSFYSQDPIQHTQLYPGVIETLEALAQRGHALALCTNKPQAPTREILERMHLARYFSHVVGGDSFPFRKPDPRMLLALLEPTGTAPERAVLVGDSEVDSATAVNAQVPFILMSYGYHRAPVGQISKTAVLDDLRLLPDLLSDRGLIGV